jgi:type I restriction enzyme S subunit
VGKPIITKIKCCIHDGFIWFDKPTFNKDFIYFIFMSEALYQGLGKLGTQLNLNTDTIGQIFIPEPPNKEQEFLVGFLNEKTTEIDSLKDNINAQIATLQQYRKSLIHECVTGKRRITEDDIQRAQQY